MSVLGRWRIVELPGYEDDYADMVEPAYILFDDGRGAFAFGCVTGAFAGGAGRRGERAAVAFDWTGHDEGGRDLRLRIGRASGQRLAPRQNPHPRRGRNPFYRPPMADFFNTLLAAIILS